MSEKRVQRYELKKDGTVIKSDTGRFMLYSDFEVFHKFYEKIEKAIEKIEVKNDRAI